MNLPEELNSAPFSEESVSDVIRYLLNDIKVKKIERRNHLDSIQDANAETGRLITLLE